ncbi:MAG: peptide chain release factor 2 [Ruminococcaceae bacterium]|nr:peptide chain release factor 2 [Oscillospiraceae bacterium]
MLQYDEYKIELQNMEGSINDLRDSLDIAQAIKKIEELENMAAEPGFWDDPEQSQKVLQKTKALKNKVEKYEKLRTLFDDTLVLIDMANMEEDESFLPEITESVKEITKKTEEMTLETLLSGEYDKNNAILTLHPGAGGTEAQDWADMLLRMYTRWAERRNFTVETMDYLPGDEAGVKSVTLLISGENAYGYLKCEKGVHRLVRISPFDSSGRRHTSFCSAEVMPEIDDDVDVDINPDELRIDTYRASGAGGQHVNKTSSAIRITHIPTGIVVACQNERSQHKNRDYAMKMLKAKLVELKEKENQAKLDDIKGEQKDIAWGSQIRSYVFHPYNLAKDHRTNYEMGNIGAVMDGDLDGFINEYLKKMSLGTLGEE